MAEYRLVFYVNRYVPMGVVNKILQAARSILGYAGIDIDWYQTGSEFVLIIRTGGV